MRANLESEVELWELAVPAELAVWERRPELQRLCAAIDDDRPLDETVVEHHLPGLSTRGRTNLIRSLVEMRLLDDQLRVSAFGRRCAKTGEAPAWEMGVYRLWVACHPLCGSLFLDFAREPGENDDRDYSNLSELPQWLRPSAQRVYESALFDEVCRFSVVRFPGPHRTAPPCRSRRLEPARLTWGINLASGENQWRITGQVEAGGARRDIRNLRGSLDAEAVVGLHARWERRWDRAGGRALIAFDGRVGADGGENFLRTMNYERVAFPEFGEFAPVEILELPVGPASEADARAWATAVTVGRVEAAGGYIAPSQWHDIWHEAVRGTPLDGRAGAPPAPGAVEVIDRRPLRPRTRWLLTAPADLDMGA